MVVNAFAFFSVLRKTPVDDIVNEAAARKIMNKKRLQAFEHALRGNAVAVTMMTFVGPQSDDTKEVMVVSFDWYMNYTSL